MSEERTPTRNDMAVLACIYLLADLGGSPEPSEVAALMAEKYGFTLDAAKQAIGHAVRDGWANFGEEPVQ